MSFKSISRPTKKSKLLSAFYESYLKDEINQFDKPLNVLWVELIQTCLVYLNP